MLGRKILIALTFLFWGQVEAVKKQKILTGSDIVYSSTLTSSSYNWNYVVPKIVDNQRHEVVQTLLKDTLPQASTGELLSQGKRVIVSLTTISTRVHAVYQTVVSLLCGQATPSLIYLFISEGGYLLDKGILPHEIPQSLLSLVVANRLTIVYVDNIGPHRKLLPLLELEILHNSIIINVDDDLGVVENSHIVYQLLKAYNETCRKKTPNTVVALRVRRIGMCNKDPYHVINYLGWTVQYPVRRKREMLMLPTGTGGILYTPSMFHPIVFNDEFRRITASADDIMFRLSTLINNASVLIACTPRIHSSGRVLRPCPVNGIDKAFSGQFSNITKCSSLELSLRLKITLDDQFSSYPLEATENGAVGDEDDEVDSTNETGTKSSPPKGLYSINRKGNNDIAWRSAIKFLQQHSLLQFNSFVKDNIQERGMSCFQNETSNRVNRQCALWPCRMK
jgi:hypothetical protein